jgi:hypothetical protein
MSSNRSENQGSFLLYYFRDFSFPTLKWHFMGAYTGVPTRSGATQLATRATHAAHGGRSEDMHEVGPRRGLVSFSTTKVHYTTTKFT